MELNTFISRLFEAAQAAGVAPAEAACAQSDCPFKTQAPIFTLPVFTVT